MQIRPITIYSGNLNSFGRSVSRDQAQTVDPETFRSADSVDVQESVSNTALVVGQELKNELYSKVQNNTSVEIGGNIELTRKGDVFEINDPANSLEISFSLTKAPQSLLNQVYALYSQSDSWLQYRPQLMDIYQNDYVVKIIRAEDLDHNNLISMEESLVAATLLADESQNLWGIKDGQGLLSNIVSELDRVSQEPVVSNQDNKVESLVNRLLTENGNISRNLYNILKNEGFRYYDSNSRYILLPEQFLEAKAGDCAEFSVLYYDVLNKCGLDAKLCQIQSPSGENTHLLAYLNIGSKVIIMDDSRYREFEGYNLEQALNEVYPTWNDYNVLSDFQVEWVYEKSMVLPPLNWQSY